MNEMKNIDSQFVAGFISAFLLLAITVLLSRAAIWSKMNPQPQAFLEFMNTPLFSILDIITGLVMLGVLFIVVIAPKIVPPHR